MSEEKKPEAPKLDFMTVAKQAGLYPFELGKETDESSLLDAPMFLIYGATGSGKTYSIRTLPKPSVVIEFDKGTQALELEAIRGELEGITIIRIPLDYPTSEIPYLSSGGTVIRKKEAPRAWKSLVKSIDTILATENLHGFKCIVVDSLTAAAEMAMIDVLYRQKQTLAIPEIQHWGEQMWMLKTDLLSKLRHISAWAPGKVSIPCVCFGHLARIKLFGGEAEGLAPQLTGKLAPEVGRYFREMYLTEKVPQGAGKQFKYQWIPLSPYAEAKSTYGFTQPMEQDFEAVFRRIEKMKVRLAK